MKIQFTLLLIATVSLSACASHSRETDVPTAAPAVAGTVLDSTDQENVRNSSVVQTLSVGPSQDRPEHPRGRPQH
jgi:outer membrane lipopolysaccharide assembly protein LptE/RlpB